MNRQSLPLIRWKYFLLTQSGTGAKKQRETRIKKRGKPLKSRVNAGKLEMPFLSLYRLQNQNKNTKKSPLLLLIAYLVFLTGMYIAGGKYIMVFFRWATRVALEKLMSKKS